MSLCPFATHRLVGVGSSGAFVGGSVPWRIVHHTTEGGTVEGVIAEFSQHWSPHFLITTDQIIQLLDTSRPAAALEHRAGGFPTNDYNAIQYESLCFAGYPKPPAILENVRKLSRWVEAEHGVPLIWPDGPAAPPNAAHQAGRAQPRSVEAWKKGGHFEHADVPGNSHWDCGYMEAERATIFSGVAFPGHGPLNVADYVVKSGDTISKIATATGVSVANLITWNNLVDANKISVGQVLKIHAPAAAPAASPPPPALAAPGDKKEVSPMFSISSVISLISQAPTIIEGVMKLVDEVEAGYAKGKAAGGDPVVIFEDILAALVANKGAVATAVLGPEPKVAADGTKK